MSFAWKFPETKFVAKNTVDEQWKHFLGERKEFLRAEPLFHQLEELVDMEHSLQTHHQIVLKQLAKVNGLSKKEIYELYVLTVNQVILKNSARGYYSKEGEEDENSKTDSPREANGQAKGESD